MRVLLIDNYDSFTHNLAQYLEEVGAQVELRRNDAIDVAGIRALAPDKIVISPGPCTPDQAGVSIAAIRELGPTTPLLGVCLGHQSIGQAFGGRVVRAAVAKHGKTSKVFHDEQGLFAGLPNPMVAARYHSLIVEPSTLPECLVVTAKTWEDEIMALRHRELPIFGVQFHPESIWTPEGKQLIRNFLLARE
jgi:anthranilate synthase/aminodeoxychorismate synthase-like glutamine amidotransferase